MTDFTVNKRYKVKKGSEIMQKLESFMIDEEDKINEVLKSGQWKVHTMMIHGNKYKVLFEKSFQWILYTQPQPAGIYLLKGQYYYTLIKKSNFIKNNILSQKTNLSTFRVSQLKWYYTQKLFLMRV